MMKPAAKATPRVLPMLAHEMLYIGIDVGKQGHVAGFVSNTLLSRHKHFEACPTLRFDNSREGFRQLIDRIQSYVPLEQCYVLVEKTGHYHRALVQYLQELDVVVYMMHVRERPKRLLKTDKRDALGLANHLYNQLEKGIQLADKLQLVRRALPPTPAAAAMQSLLRHRAELVQETTQRKNKLTAICDELFPEFTTIFKDPNGTTALAIRKAFPTPHALATASLHNVQVLRPSRRPSIAQLVVLQQLAGQSIGCKDVDRQRGLILEQTQLIKELQLMQEHIATLDAEIQATITSSREGRIVMSVPGWGPIPAATLIAAIGHVGNFPTAATFKAFCGWAPRVSQSGTSYDQAALSRGGSRLIKSAIFLVVGHAIQLDCEWKRLYERLVPQKCAFDERTRTYKGKLKVYGRIAGQMLALIYALLKQDLEVVARTPRGEVPPEPILYDAAIHRAHRAGHYRSSKPRVQPGKIVQLPKQ